MDLGELEKYEVYPNDIFFVRSSLKLEGVGVSARIKATPEPTVYECHVTKITPHVEKIKSEFLIFYLNSCLVRQRLVALAETTTMTTISQPKLGSIEIVCPPIDEQLEIVDQINLEWIYITQLAERIQYTINLLNQYRAALISAAVTGKIDVREWQAS